MEAEPRSGVSTILRLVFVVGCALALAVALCPAAFDPHEVGRALAGNEETPLLESAPNGAPARSLRLAEIPQHAGVIVPRTSDDRPRVFTPSKPGACLHFIHIPKTGGSTMEDLWDHMNPSADPRIPGWSRTNWAATCTGNKPGQLPESHKPGNTFGELFNQEKFRRCKVPGGLTCNFFHTPPGQDPLLWKTGYEPCDTFCIVRHPLDKFESEWKYRTGKQCNTPQSQGFFNTWARAKLGLLSKGSLYIDDCHLLPMKRFVFHSSPGVPQKRTCTHILRFERLEEDFAQLMAAYNYSLSLKGKVTNQKGTCAMNIPDDILAKVRMVYSEDYGLFEYD